MKREDSNSEQGQESRNPNRAYCCWFGNGTKCLLERRKTELFHWGVHKDHVALSPWGTLGQDLLIQSWPEGQAIPDFNQRSHTAYCYSFCSPRRNNRKEPHLSVNIWLPWHGRAWFSPESHMKWIGMIKWHQEVRERENVYGSRNSWFPL